MAESGADALGIDWTIDIAQAKQRVGARVALQGNMDPAVLFAGPVAIEHEAKQVLDAFARKGGRSGHVFNLGHGISQYTPPEHVEALVNFVHRATQGV
jgi:Uroporphyrinogen-III decarboxylase